MATGTTAEAFKAWFDANWNGTARRHENETYQAPAPAVSGEPAPFVFLEIVGDSYAQQSIGDVGGNLWREEGRAVFTVCTASGIGAELARGYACALRTMLKGLRLAPGITCRQMALGYGDKFKLDGNYYSVPLVVRWQRDETR